MAASTLSGCQGAWWRVDAGGDDPAGPNASWTRWHPMHVNAVVSG